MEEKREFKKGDFIRSKSKPASFAIFEGIDLNPSYTYSKRYTVAAFFDPDKYCQNENGCGWSSRPVLEVATKTKPCEKTVDTLKEDYSWVICTEKEKEVAIKVLLDHGFEWNEELLSLIDIESGEIVHKVIIPKLEYKGNIIKPITDKFKMLLRSYTEKENKPNYNYGRNYDNGYGYNYSSYGRYNDYDCWD